MLKVLKGDLHIHTCLSPCGDKDMMPENIIKSAKNKGLDFIGICDHNSAENVLAVKSKGKKFGVDVLGGIEITSKEEVHILAFFDSDSSLLKIQKIVYENLNLQENDPALFGEQIIVDEDSQVIGTNKRLLIGATELKIEKIVDIIHDLDGLAIASHVDRPAFSIIGQLGFVPEELKLDALELSPLYTKENRKDLLLPPNSPRVFFSDAHRLEEIGNATTSFLLESASCGEIKKALLNQDERKVMT